MNIVLNGSGSLCPECSLEVTIPGNKFFKMRDTFADAAFGIHVAEVSCLANCRQKIPEDSGAWGFSRQ